MKSITVAVFALLAGAPMLSNQEALASNCCDDGIGNTAPNQTGPQIPTASSPLSNVGNKR